MNLTIYPLNWFSSLLTTTVTAAVLIISQPVLVIANTPREIADIAKPITVRIDSQSGSGSGFIVAKNKDAYIVLTNSHVVKGNVAYTISTFDGKKYPVTAGISFQVKKDDPDLAILQFNSTNQYPVATLGNSDLVNIGDPIYIYGYPAIGGRRGNNREAEFSPGYITSIRQNEPQGYNLRFNALTWGGMSGSPVLNGNARVIGVHGQGDLGLAEGYLPDSSGRFSRVPLVLPTGFNSAIPINNFVDIISKSGLNLSDLNIDNNSATKTNQLNLSNPQTAEEFFVRGLIHAEKGDTWDAIADYTRALRINPNYTLAYYHRGIARYQMGYMTDAIADYNQIIRLDSKDARAYYNRGIVRFKLEDKRKAIRDFQISAELFQKQGDDSKYQNLMDTIQKLQR
ncbi:trypsin-like peptidase domain-containing protein [Calothrix sp. NIES-3974]|uniref:trypsin-like peptidase domain-containing protein n=1 Tax=Calothrix sp. NIES-3974 TaxID=2005462 RepID=UPI000B617ED2|nr:trypsin-like peptidase domain-containing protein [Calothrix sp. NIES-3974]BAZ04060.1 TPR domain protein [Calothrix sp. NIES-3974]